MELDRAAIERKDFPVGRQGYDQAAVDAHLRALAGELEELKRAANSAGPDGSLPATAASQVQGILAAAEATAAEIERDAREGARRVREAAEREAQRPRAEAAERSRAHLAAIGRITTGLQERVAGLQGELRALLESLREADRLAAGLQGAETETGRPDRAASAPRAGEAEANGTSAGDLDSARLIALNMALEGRSRSDIERYLAESFELADSAELLDEVFARLEG